MAKLDVDFLKSLNYGDHVVVSREDGKIKEHAVVFSTFSQRHGGVELMDDDETVYPIKTDDRRELSIQM